MSKTERALSILARPFEVAFTILLVPFGKRRGTLVPMVIVSLLAVAMTNCHNREENWSGAEAIERGMILKVAATEPQCACLTLTNKSAVPITLRTRFKDTYFLGLMTLQPHATTVALFDWAGEQNDDVYHILAYGPDGKPVKIADDVQFAHSGFAECSRMSCEIGPLKMNAGLAAGH
jgi:hypothetical protein